MEPTVELPPEVAHVYISDELDGRDGAGIDYLTQNSALKNLARQMIGDPDLVLPKLVDLSMEICAASAGGISLYEPFPAPGVFRWHHLRGELESFTGATTPRNYSPCGITLDLESPVLVQRPERAYAWLQEANVSLPECLLVPLYVSESEPIGTLWIVSEDEGQFNSGHRDAMNELAAFTGIALKMAIEQRKLINALEEQKDLTNEMGHRVKNLFSIIDALIRMASRRGGTAEELAARVSGRLHALSMAHGLVNPAFDGGDRRGNDFDYVLRTVLSPYDRNNFIIEGPGLHIGPRAKNVIALILHELATNAAKYGSLCSVDGRISVKWTTKDGRLQFTWQEIDGPPVISAPSQTGFGASLAERSIQSLDGTISYKWRPEGLLVTIELRVDRLTS